MDLSNLAANPFLVDAVAATSDDGLIVCDANGRFVVFNAAAQKLLARTAEDVPPERWAEHYDIRDADGNAPVSPERVPLNRALHGAVVAGEHLSVARPGGSRVLLRVNARPIVSPDGVPAGAVVSFAAAGDIEAPADAGGLATGPGADDLVRALADGEFRLVYQPEIALGSTRVVGVEALLRWHHPKRGVVPPLDFIPDAEASGAIVPIGAWVLQESCRQAAEWARHAGSPFLMSVNVSPRQFRPGLVDEVVAALEASGLAPDCLCLEITESVVLDDTAFAVETLRELRALGVRVAVDDFGTGYSSLSHLRALPFDLLKIDRSFIADMSSAPVNAAILSAVVGMAHALSLQVIAEGVETNQQSRELHGFGCEYAQGFYFARPLEADAVLDVLRDGIDVGQLDGASTPRSLTANAVVVADDSPDVLRLTALTLRAAGMDVYEAGSGADALALARAHRPACVVLDVRMPDISGFEVARQLRSDAEMTDVKIVLLTSASLATDKVAGFSVGADDYITKPYDRRELVAKVKQHVGG